MKKASLPMRQRAIALRKPTLALALLATCGLAPAMDLLQAYDAARQNDPNILAARAAADIGRERLPQAIAQQLPNVSFSAQYGKNQLASTSPNFLGVDQTINTEYPSTSQTLTIRQPIYRGYLFAQTRQAQAQFEDAEATLAQEEQNLLARVTGSYLEALLSQEQLELVLAQRAASTTQLDIARKAFAAGAGTRTDIDEAQARLDSTLALEIEARQNMAYTLRQLEQLTGSPSGVLARLNLANFTLTDPQPANLDSWIARAERSSPQLRSLQAQLETARQEVEKASSGHEPTLDATVQWTSSASENVYNIRNSYTNASVGVQLTIPIYSGGYTSSQVRQALAQQERASQALEAGRRDLGMRVFRELRGLTENIPKVRALEKSLSSAEQLIVSNRKSFQAGTRTVIDILNAEQQRFLVLRDLAQARYVYLSARVRLLSLVGEADLGALTTINQMFGP